MDSGTEGFEDTAAESCGVDVEASTGADEEEDEGDVAEGGKEIEEAEGDLRIAA